MSQLFTIPSISDACKAVVSATEAALIADPNVNFGSGLEKKLYFLQGSKREIMTVLQAWSDSPEKKDKRYPLVALFRDVKEKMLVHNYGMVSEAPLHLAIFTLTDPTFRADTREELNFKPILHPIFSELIRQFTLSDLFEAPTVENMKIVKWDCYFYGTQPAEKNVLNDYIDAIDIESITLKVKPICSPITL